GYATPSVAGGRVYVMANKGLEDEFVTARDAKDGRPLWSTRVGKVGNPDQQPNYPAARSTPTVDGAVLYALGSDGDLACLEAATGKLLWRYDKTTGPVGMSVLTPVVGEGLVYSGNDRLGGAAVRLTAGGGAATAEEVYRGMKLPRMIGGAVLVGEYLYGASG